MKYLKKIFVLVISVLLIAGCGKDKLPGNDKREEDKEAKKLQIVDESKDTRSYAVMINNNHQASLISRKLLLEIPYDESYKIAADMKFNIEAIICNNCSFKTIDTIICNYEVGGRSATVKHKNEVDRIFKELFPERVLIDYEHLRYHRFWPASILWNLTYKVAHIIWPYKLKLKIKQLLSKGISDYDKNRIVEMKAWKLKN